MGLGTALASVGVNISSGHPLTTLPDTSPLFDVVFGTSTSSRSNTPNGGNAGVQDNQSPSSTAIPGSHHIDGLVDTFRNSNAFHYPDRFHCTNRFSGLRN
jgi:hypothetical protein